MKTSTLLFCAIIGAYSINSSAQIKSIGKPKLGKGNNPVEAINESPAQTYINSANNDIKNLEEKLKQPKWSDKSGWVNGYKSSLESLGKNLEKIKEKDSKYNTKDMESKYTYFTQQKDEGLKQVADIKQAEKDKAATDKKTAEDAATAAMHERATDEGITSSLHEKNIGKILFSSAEISKTNPAEAAITNSFSISKPIYFRAYFKESVFNTLVAEYPKDYLARDCGYWCKIYIDDKLVAETKSFSRYGNTYYVTDKEKKTFTTINGVLDLNLDKLGSIEYYEALRAMESSLMNGEHTVKMELYPSHQKKSTVAGALIASGEFKLSGGANWFNPKDEKVCMPKAVKSDPALEAKFLEGAKKYMTSNNRKGELKKVVIRSGEWEINKNQYTGLIESRTMKAAISVNENGACKYIEFMFTQAWDGAKYQSSVTTDITGTEAPIFCGCIK